MRLISFLFCVGCVQPGPVAVLPETPSETPCGNFSAWLEIPSPFVGERCFAYANTVTKNSVGVSVSSVVCKRADSVFLDKCADPTKRPTP